MADRRDPPTGVLLAGTHNQEPRNYTLVNETYVAEQGEVFPLSKLDEVLQSCIDARRNFVLVFSNKEIQLH
jgi:hypothetical protein